MIILAAVVGFFIIGSIHLTLRCFTGIEYDIAMKNKKNTGHYTMPRHW